MPVCLFPRLCVAMLLAFLALPGVAAAQTSPSASDAAVVPLASPTDAATALPSVSSLPDSPSIATETPANTALEWIATPHGCMRVASQDGLVTMRGYAPAEEALTALSQATGLEIALGPQAQDFAGVSVGVEADRLRPVDILLRLFPARLTLVQKDHATSAVTRVTVTNAPAWMAVTPPLAVSADELNVQVPVELSDALTAYASASGLEVAARIPELSMALLRLKPQHDLSAVAQTLLSMGFPTVRPNILGRGQATGAAPVNDEFYPRQTLLTAMSIPSAWELYAQLSAPAQVTCAVVDSGVAWDHPDLVAGIWVNAREALTGRLPNNYDDDGNGYVDDIYGFNFVAARSTAQGYTSAQPYPTDSHGTCVAGIIAATPNNAIGLAGVARNTQIMNVKLLDSDGSQLTSTFTIAQAIMYAAQNGAKVINCSFSFEDADTFVEQACRKAVDQGAVIVCAAGNTGTSKPQYPAAFNLPGMISVGVVDVLDQPAVISSFGSWVHVFATGSAVTTIIPYRGSSGTLYEYGTVGAYTSYAAAAVSGVASLLMSAKPGLSPVQAVQAITASVDVLPQLAGKCTTSGRVNAAMALSRALAMETQPSSGSATSGTPTQETAPAGESPTAAGTGNSSGGGGCAMAEGALGLEWLLAAGALLWRLRYRN